MENELTFAQQAEAYLADIASVARPNTLHVYRSLLTNRILPAIGGLEMEAVDNLAVKSLVSRLAEAELSPATINLTVTLVKQIVKSAVDKRGNPRYPVQWNGSFIKAPKVEPESQKAPICPLGTLQTALDGTSGDTQALILLLASTGLRIGETLAIGRGNAWDPEAGTITVQGTMIDGEFQPAPKTKAGKRVVDLHPEVSVLLKALYPSEEARKGTLFPMSEDTYRNRIDRLGIPGFHSLRRFRITHLQMNEAPETLTKFWAGHAAKDVTERYTKVKSQVEARKVWTEKAGLGFTL
jgi:integrase